MNHSYPFRDFTLGFTDWSSLPIILAVGNTDWPVYYLYCKSNNIPWYPYSWLHIPVWCCCCSGQVELITILSQEINFLFRRRSSSKRKRRFSLLLLLFCNFSLGRGEMPNQEVYDCQPFSELCTRADLILSSSFKPEEMETSFLFQWDLAGVFL